MAQGARAFTHDAAGKVTSDDRTGGGHGYTYDAAGQMATFRVNGVLQASYKYDFAARQVVRALSGGAVIHSVFDADGTRRFPPVVHPEDALPGSGPVVSILPGLHQNWMRGLDRMPAGVGARISD